MDVNIIVKNITEKTILATYSEPGSPDCVIIVASTAAASPLGIIMDKNALSLLLTFLMLDGNETRTIGILIMISKSDMQKPISNEAKLSNFIDIPTYTKKNVFIRKTNSLNSVFSIGLSRVGFLWKNLFSHLWCIISIFANAMPNANAEIIPLYPKISFIPYIIKTKAGVVKMELSIVLTLSSIIDQNMAPKTPINDAKRKEEKTCPKIIPTFISPILYDSKIANVTTMHRIALNADSNINIVLLFSPMLICFTNGIATAEDEPPSAAPNMKLTPGFMPNTNQPNRPMTINVTTKFIVVRLTVVFIESANDLNDSSVPLSNNRITSVSCPNTLPMELNLSASTTFKSGPIIMPINISNNTSGILFLLNISANQCAAKTNVPNVNISKAGSIAKFSAKVQNKLIEIL